MASDFTVHNIFGGKYDLIQLHRQIIHENDWIFESARANWNITVCYGTPCTTFGEILIKPISASTEAKSSKILEIVFNCQ